MARFFAGEESRREEGKIILTGPDVNHMKNVLRMKPGEMAEVVWDGMVLNAEIAAYPGDEAVLDILSEKPAGNELKARITLYQGLPKQDKLELIVQKAVELGACRIVPVDMKRCVARWDEKKEAARRKRYQAIAESAAKQAGRDMIPEIGPLLRFKDALKEAEEENDIILFPYEKADGMAESRGIVESLPKDARIAVFIGPEGGFDPEEVREAEEKNARIITLGPRILRTETAGLAVLSILMFHLNE
ncbi:MAG: 16S rRNA (uracil(1498)-N(3))-methyltransferase [Lachnospiraceae bacterium]|nr:16S rRNA (uracil(1498)-N(3))-methyltransferase [Lachnospiraceae bacterium]